MLQSDLHVRLALLIMYGIGTVFLLAVMFLLAKLNQRFWTKSSIAISAIIAIMLVIFVTLTFVS
ncbi:hypothetical protein [Lentilactobacillus sp. Marseille-Q4993]|uniref:hypothetical protein n=1 Tax=Lentilactobacillus sp. Marseille-Q4993 TaxID=3039492 RepID=UPI0024BCF115|nr:hypothetical protein [Lentilactobacillus sp. Marseille-Q4993]